VSILPHEAKLCWSYFAFGKTEMDEVVMSQRKIDKETFG